MIALATEVTIWLLVSSALGLIAGFALARAFMRPQGAEPQVITDDDEILQVIDELRRDRTAKDAEMAVLRAQLDDLRRQPEPSAEVTSATEEMAATMREQLERLRVEREDQQREIQSFKEQNTSLRRRLDETADRLVEFERKRMQRSMPDASKPVQPVHSPASPPDAESAPQPRDPAVAREREREQLELDVEKSSPLQVGHETEPEERAETLSKSIDVEPNPVPAHEKPLDDISSMPADLIDRLKLVGASTTTQLLAKAAARARRNALATSLRLDPESLMQYVHRADLIRVGMRDADVDHLFEAGVRTLAALAAAKPEALTNRLESISRRGSGREESASAATIKRWIETAGALPAVVEE